MNSGPTRASIIAAILAIVAGIGGAVFGVVHIVRDVVHTVTAPSVTLPAHVEKHLDAGDYDIYQRTGTRQGNNGFNLTENGPVTLTPADVSVSGLDGSRLGVGLPTANETLTRGDAIYTAAVRFSVLQAGTYDIDVQRPFGRPGDESVIITKSFGNIARSAVPWVFLIIGSGLLALVSVVVLIVMLVRSRRQRAPAVGAPAYAGAAQPAPPPGWYPDPGGQAAHRWWDGTRWTDHTG